MRVFLFDHTLAATTTSLHLSKSLCNETTIQLQLETSFHNNTYNQYSNNRDNKIVKTRSVTNVMRFTILRANQQS